MDLTKRKVWNRAPWGKLPSHLVSSGLGARFARKDAKNEGTSGDMYENKEKHCRMAVTKTRRSHETARIQRSLTAIWRDPCPKCSNWQ